MDIEAIGEAVRIWDGMSMDTGSSWRRQADSKAQRPEESKGKGAYSRAACRRRSREQEYQHISSL